MLPGISAFRNPNGSAPPLSSEFYWPIDLAPAAPTSVPERNNTVLIRYFAFNGNAKKL